MEKPFAITIVLMLVALSVVSSFAQVADDIPDLVCPRFEVIASTHEAKEGEAVTFTASLTGGNVDLSKLSYSFSISPRAGTIRSGGSPNVQVLDTSSVKSGSVVVTVSVPFQMCPKTATEMVLIRRGAQYAQVDDFWLWFQRHSDAFRDYKKDTYAALSEELSERLRAVDERLIVKIDHKWTRGKIGFIVGYRDKPADEKVIEDFLRSAPDLPGFETLSAKEICELAF